MSDKNNTPKSIEELMKLLMQGQELSPAQQKQMDDYKFWKTQPVPRLDEQIVAEGVIDGEKSVTQVPDAPYPLIEGFEWSTINLEDSNELEEVYRLLYENYVEDRDATIRFKYSHDFFRWALLPPGWVADWFVGVRVKQSKALVGFIAAVPSELELTASTTKIKSVLIDFLCVHKKLRSKRLTPVLIKEITRRVNKRNIWQALYTAGTVLPSPISVCRYTHRPLNWPKLLDVDFSHLPANKTIEDMVSYYETSLETQIPGWREMKESDLDQVYDLFSSYQRKFQLIQIFSKEELSHWLLGGAHGEVKAHREIIKTYVVEIEGKITDFISYYLLPFTVLQNPKHDGLGVAYLFYYATDATGDAYKNRLFELVNDALVTAKSFGVDVFNCLTSQDNALFIKDAKFGIGDGFLNYYLFNYRSFPILGGIDPKTKDVSVENSGGVGVVFF